MARRQVTQRRTRVWARKVEGLLSLSEGSFVCHDLLDSYNLDAGVSSHAGFTVARQILTVAVDFPTETDQIDSRMVVGLRRDLPGADVSPSVSPHADWLFWTVIYPNEQGGSADATVRHIDVKGMRRLQETEETLLLCVAFDSAAVTPGPVAYSFASSVLLLQG